MKWWVERKSKKKGKKRKHKYVSKESRLSDIPLLSISTAEAVPVMACRRYHRAEMLLVHIRTCYSGL